jgi:hypothetical protein
MTSQMYYLSYVALLILSTRILHTVMMSIILLAILLVPRSTYVPIQGHTYVGGTSCLPVHVDTSSLDDQTAYCGNRYY